MDFNKIFEGTRTCLAYEITKTTGKSFKKGQIVFYPPREVTEFIFVGDKVVAIQQRFLCKLTYSQFKSSKELIAYLRKKQKENKN